jgi:hypothetical protein
MGYAMTPSVGFPARRKLKEEKIKKMKFYVDQGDIMIDYEKRRCTEDMMLEVHHSSLHVTHINVTRRKHHDTY